MSKLLTVDGTSIYTYEPKRRVNDKQWLCKYQAKPAIVEEQNMRVKVSYAIRIDLLFKLKCQS